MNYKRITDFKNKDGEEYTSAVRIECCCMQREYQEDYLLPDYLPDAKKVLKYTCSPIVESAFMGNSSLEYNGSVYIKILYLSEQSQLCSASFTMSFEDKLSNDNITDDCVDMILPKVYSCSCRLQNPRKFNLRIKAGADVEIWKRVGYMPEVYGVSSREEENSIQTNPALNEGMWVLSAKEDEMIFSTDISVDKSMADVEEVIFTGGEVVFDECRGGNNEIICKGGCNLEILYKGSDGGYYFIKRSVPVSENLKAANICDESSAIAYAFAKPIDINVSEDEFGARRIIEIEMDYSLNAICFSPKQIYLTTDGYSTLRECQNSYTKREVYSKGEKIAGGFSVNESLPLEDAGISSKDKILSFSCRPELEMCSEPGKKGRIAFEGECGFELLLIKEDGTAYTASFKLPIKYESDRSVALLEGMECKCTAKASGVRIRTDDGKVYVDLEIGFCAVILRNDSVELLESMRILPVSIPRENDRGSIVVCYPCNSDDEWTIGKKYKVTRESLSEYNTMTREMPRVVRIPYIKK